MADYTSSYTGAEVDAILGKADVTPIVFISTPEYELEGMMLFDTTNSVFKQYNGSSWVTVSTPHKAIGADIDYYHFYVITDGVMSQSQMSGWEEGWYVDYRLHGLIGTIRYYGGEYGGWKMLPNTGTSTVTSLANLPVKNRLVVATISTNQSSVNVYGGAYYLSYVGEVHVIVKATAAVTITLPTSSPYVLCSADSTLTLANGDIAEINFVCDGTNIYVRAIS